jgi:hypothetical protein
VIEILRKLRSGFRQRTPVVVAATTHARLTAQLWCTGEDSNLRTSLGGTDLQSVGFNHSPTCAENYAPRSFAKIAQDFGSGLPLRSRPLNASTLGRCGRSRFVRQTAFCLRALPSRKPPRSTKSHFVFRQTGKPGSRVDNREDHCTPGNDPNGVPWKNLSRRLQPNPPPAGKIFLIQFTIPEIPRKLRSGFRLRAHSFATLRVTPAKRLNLELAKGFEPPTL